MTDVVLVSIDDGVADVRLNRPAAMNAFNDDLFEGLIDTGERLRSTSGLRAVVISGEGRGFCAGLDTSSFAAQTSGAALISQNTDGDPQRWGDLGVEGFDDPLAAAREWARTVASRNPHAVRNAKALTAMASPVDPAALVAERAAMWSTISTPNQLEAVRAALDKRDPQFSD